MEFIDIERVSIVALVIAILGAGFKKLWVWGYQLSDMTADRDFWRDAALKTMRVAEKSVDFVPRGRTDA